MKHKSKLKTTTSRKEYKILSNPWIYEMYIDEGWSQRNGLYSYQIRMYRSWKYNRKKQYKNVCSS